MEFVLQEPGLVIFSSFVWDTCTGKYARFVNLKLAINTWKMTVSIP